jgi:histidinol-phosphate/aromatic aminotransferase/cobyric acid decarboxylase-like protein
VNANFVLVDFSSESRASEIFDKLNNKGIKTCPGWSDEFDGELNSCIRFAVGNEKDMRIVLKVLRS